MCGICGYAVLEPNGVVETRSLASMCQSLAHRGPDDEGMWVRGGAALGHRRLSIIDLVGGRQPLSNEDGSVWVTYNGEVYNFHELRRELIDKGHRFATRSDTEVLVHLYEEDGVDFMRRLSGMFALAIWDERSRRLILTRDRMGQKPLYWGIFGGMLIFASEMKGMLAHRAVTPVLDLDSLSRFLALQVVPCPHSIFKGVRKLPPAGRLVLERGEAREDAYWEYPLGGSRLDMSLTEAQEELRELLRRSVKRHLMTEVPLGVFLSGGIDSTTIAAMMRQAGVNGLKSFSIGFEDSSFDESPYARLAAKRLGTEHFEDRLAPSDCLTLAPELGRLLSEPFADPSVIPTYLLSRFARRHVTVALGGDGSDELSAGYPTHLAHRCAAYYEKLPNLLRRGVIELSMSRLPGWTNRFRWAGRARKLVSAMSEPPGVPRHYAWRGSFSPKQQADLFTEDAWRMISPDSAYDQPLAYEAACRSPDPVERLLYLDAKLYMQDDVLAKVDRASMAVGLEVRSPFLDPQVVEFFAQLPLRYKLRGLTTKYVLKRAVRELVPSEIIRRRKQGFAIPVADWLRRDLRPLLEDHLSAERLRCAGIFRPESVRRLLDDHFACRRDNQKYLWPLLVFELWREQYGRTAPKEAL